MRQLLEKDRLLAGAIALFAVCGGAYGADESGGDDKSPVDVAPLETRSNVSHEDIGPGVIVRKVDQHKQQSSIKGKGNKKDISLICYMNGVCLVRDRRPITTISGPNKFTFDNLYAGLDRASVNFCTPKKGKIIVQNFTINENAPSRLEIFNNSIGREIFYQRSESANMEKGTLLAIFPENDEHYALLKADGKNLVIPLKKCVAVGAETLKSFGQHSLDLVFDVTEADDFEIEVSYLTKNIYWKHICFIDVFEKMDRVDITAQALVKNESGHDIEDAEIIFATASPFSGGASDGNAGDDYRKDDNCDGDGNGSTLNYKRKLSIKNHSDATCVLKTTKEINPRLEYAATIPFDAVCGLATKKESNLIIKNLLVVENAAAVGLEANFNGEIFLFSRMQGERNFLGKLTASSIRRGNDLAFEICRCNGENDVLGSVRLTDVRKISEKDRENWISVVLKNCKSIGVTVQVTMAVTGQWRVSKENFEMQKSDKPMWRLSLEPNETKELHFRMTTRAS
ncbi:MAG: hypothetical protein LBJ16_04270 [Holosporaceae bacterium]|nr:hypothetical protein [Holosporaceae bacterium]